MNLSIQNTDQISTTVTLVSFQDQRDFLTRIKDLSIAIFKEFRSRRQRSSNPLRKNAHNLFPAVDPNTASYNITNLPWTDGNSSKLVVLIHGLNSSPLAFTNYLTELSNTDSTSCFAPYVYKKGYCKLKEAARPILEVVQLYAKQYPDNKICLVGHSNGARIAAYIEQKLKAKNIHLISIAGPHLGSKLITKINLFGIKRCFGINATMVDELTYQGAYATKKLLKWQAEAKNNNTITKNVKRYFFATPDDIRIFPSETCFPNLPDSSYTLIAQESHVTIIDAVKDNVLSLL